MRSGRSSSSRIFAGSGVVWSKRRLRRGSKPTNEYRPTFSPRSTLSSKNASALSPDSAANAATGVMASALSSRTTGMMS